MTLNLKTIHFAMAGMAYQVSWSCAEGFGEGPWTSLPGNFSGLGRCSNLDSIQ